MSLRTSATDRITILSGGNVGIGTAAPTDLLSVNGNASKPGGGTWAIFSDERLKNIKGPFNSGLKAVMQLQPIRYEYKADNALGIKVNGQHIGFGAQAVQQVIPEAVTETSNGYLMVNNDPIIWAMLNAIKEQQREIEKLRTEVRKLRTVSRRRR
jgi:Chaperone of endosialidase